MVLERRIKKRDLNKLDILINDTSKGVELEECKKIN